MRIHTIDPLQDDQWVQFVNAHASASIFHTREWLASLSLTYGYRPLGLVEISSTGRITSALPLCVVKSWITGTRLVSVPFADHCEPLGWAAGDMPSLRAALEDTREKTKADYVELRPIGMDLLGGEQNYTIARSASYKYHSLDLAGNIDRLFDGLHVSCIQRKIRRAEAVSLRYETGQSEELMRRFYTLMVKTRRRHRLFPQPIAWFRNLAAQFGDKLIIHLASKEGRALAGIITIQHQGKLVYKYGASDENFHAMGGMPFLLWRAILHGKSVGASQLDLGRTDHDSVGVSTFKERFGANSYNLTYYRLANPTPRNRLSFRARPFMVVVTQLPDSICSIVGRMLYKHAA